MVRFHPCFPFIPIVARSSSTCAEAWEGRKYLQSIDRSSEVCPLLALSLLRPDALWRRSHTFMIFLPFSSIQTAHHHKLLHFPLWFLPFSMFSFPQSRTCVITSYCLIDFIIVQRKAACDHDRLPSQKTFLFLTKKSLWLCQIAFVQCLFLSRQDIIWSRSLVLSKWSLFVQQKRDSLWSLTIYGHDMILYLLLDSRACTNYRTMKSMWFFSCSIRVRASNMTLLPLYAFCFSIHVRVSTISLSPAWCIPCCESHRRVGTISLSRPRTISSSPAWSIPFSRSHRLASTIRLPHWNTLFL